MIATFGCCSSEGSESDEEDQPDDDVGEPVAVADVPAPPRAAIH